MPDNQLFLVSPRETLHRHRAVSTQTTATEHNTADTTPTPQCGVQLSDPADWQHLHEPSALAVVTEHNLTPCSSCIDNAYHLNRVRKARHTNRIVTLSPQLSDDV